MGNRVGQQTAFSPTNYAANKGTTSFTTLPRRHDAHRRSRHGAQDSKRQARPVHASFRLCLRRPRQRENRSARRIGHVLPGSAPRLLQPQSGWQCPQYRLPSRSPIRGCMVQLLVLIREARSAIHIAPGCSVRGYFPQSLPVHAAVPVVPMSSPTGFWSTSHDPSGNFHVPVPMITA